MPSLCQDGLGHQAEVSSLQIQLMDWWHRLAHHLIVADGLCHWGIIQDYHPAEFPMRKNK